MRLFSVGRLTVTLGVALVATFSSVSSTFAWNGPEEKNSGSPHGVHLVITHGDQHVLVVDYHPHQQVSSVIHSDQSAPDHGSTSTAGPDHGSTAGVPPATTGGTTPSTSDVVPQSGSATSNSSSGSGGGSKGGSTSGSGREKYCEWIGSQNTWTPREVTAGTKVELSPGGRKVGVSQLPFPENQGGVGVFTPYQPYSGTACEATILTTASPAAKLEAPQPAPQPALVSQDLPGINPPSVEAAPPSEPVQQMAINPTGAPNDDSLADEPDDSVSPTNPTSVQGP